MAGKPQSTYTQARSLFAAVMGDSLSHSIQGQLPIYLYWPTVLEGKLNALGAPIQVRNFAKDGNHTGNTGSNMLARFGLMTRYGIPDLGIIMAGVNDPGNSITTAQTQANLQAMIKWLKFGCAGAVNAETDLPANGLPGQRYVVMVDGSTTGGVAADATQTPTISGAGGAVQSVWEYRNGRAGASGWGRIALAATPADRCRRIVLVSTQYRNWPGGDTPTVPGATYATIRGAQAAAATAEGASYFDLYEFLRARIVAGLDPDYSVSGFDAATSWHPAASNQHLNQYGNELVAQGLAAFLSGRTWFSELKGV
jgi:hypothetical protein